MTPFWKIILTIAIIYLIVGLIVWLVTGDPKRGLYWIGFVFEETDFPDSDDDNDWDWD